MKGQQTSSRNWLGEWWLPGRPATKISGELQANDDGKVRLHLIGELTAPRKDGETRRLPIVLGESNTGDLVTLVDCLDCGRSHRLRNTHRVNQTLLPRFIGDGTDRSSESLKGSALSRPRWSSGRKEESSVGGGKRRRMVFGSR